MNRILNCFRFQTGNMIKNTLTFIFFYIFICVGLLSITLISDDIRVSSFSSGFYIGSIIFTFVYVIADYKSSFNYLLIYGNTRRTIFLSRAMTNTILSVLMAVISSISIIVDGLITKLSGTGKTIDNNLLHFMYPNSNKASEFLFLAVLLIMITSFSTLYGALAYRLGKIFITAFWVCFGLSFMLLPISSRITPTNNIVKLINTYLCLENPNGILLASVNFIITALIFSALTYLVSSRQPQTAPV